MTDALAELRRMGKSVYAFEMEATRQDFGELLDQANALLGGMGEIGVPPRPR